MIYRLAWRNIWRNKLRSGIIIGAIGIGMFAGTFLMALLKGWSTGILREYLDMQLSSIQIHKAETEGINNANDHFPEQQAMQVLDATPAVTGYASRLKVNTVLTSAETSAGVTLIGVDVEPEKRISRIYTTIPDSLGDFLSDSVANPIVISRETARHLGVRLRSKLVLNLQSTTGEMQSTLFRVGGIFSTHSKRFDGSTAYVRKADLLPYLEMPQGAVHEIAVMTDDPERCLEEAALLTQRLPGLKADGWSETYPLLTVSFFWIKVFSYVFLCIFLTALSFGIVNTMQMAVLERQKEFRMLERIGMSPWLILKMVMLETVFLTVVGAFAGTALALAVVAFTARGGIDLSVLFNLRFAYGFGEVIYPEFSVGSLGVILLLVMVSAVLSAILPMHKALKIIK